MDIDLSNYKEKRICVAVSGGGDSVALLHYFYVNAGRYNITLTACHCEHGIRGKSSVSDANFVKALCKEWDIPLFCFQADCPTISLQEKISLETAARNFRYAAFESLLKENKTDCIATAHHMGDNAETVLFRIVRGASLTGASGIKDRKGYIRPLLNVSKQEIEEYLKSNALTYCTDETNEDITITRNYIRKEVLPKLEALVPNATEQIVHFAHLAAEDDEYLYRLAEKSVTKQEDVYAISFSQEKPIFRRACLLVLKGMGVEKDYTHAHLEGVFALQTAQNGAKYSLPCGVVAVREYDKIVLFRQKEKTDEKIPFSFGSFKIGDVAFCVEKRCERTNEKGFFDVKKIPQTAIFRTRRDGDVFTKFGGGTKKLKEYLIDRKIPVRQRDELVVLADGNEILAIIGVEISEKIKVDQNSEIGCIYIV